MDTEQAFAQMGEFARIFDFPIKAQKYAVGLFDDLAKQRDEIFARQNAANGEEIANQWKSVVAIKANELARHIDPSYQPGAQAGNSELTMIVRNRFFGMFTQSGTSGEQILKAKSAIEDMMVG